MQNQEKYIIYVRKSTDVEDKQVLSMEAQIVELRKYAADSNLQIVGTVIEKKSAKVPGRKKFNQIMTDIEHGKANGILSWHPDRLARNSVDGGHVIYLLDQSLLVALKFPTFWFENTSQGKFMLSMAFSQSKYYVDNLSENTKRGLRQKVRRGEFPSKAPVGYINDVRHKSIVVDKRLAPLIVQAFEMYALGNKSMQAIAYFLYDKGGMTKGKKPLSKDQIKKILTNPFYYGHFRYGGEVHEGKHPAIISKQLYDRVQAVLSRRCYPQKGATAPQAFCGLLRCGACNMSITAEKKVKHQKNGNVHEYVYYRCSRKSKTMRCVEPTVTEPDLQTQLVDILQGYALPKSWANALTTMLEEGEKKAEQSSGLFIADAQNKISSLQSKLQRLLDSYLDQDIDQATYKVKQAELMSEKKSLEEQVGKLTLAANAWVEPMRQWIKQASDLNEITKTAKPSAIMDALAKVEGLNLFLKSKKAQPTAAPAISPPCAIWVLLRKTLEKTGATRLKSLESPILVHVMHRYSSKAYLSDLFRRLGCDRRAARAIAEPAGSSRLLDRLSNAHIEQLVTMHDRGVSNTEIATRFGISTYSVRLQLAQGGRGIYTSFTQVQIQTAHELKRTGYSHQRIAEKLGLSASSVRLLVATAPRSQ